jgi:hypothetical protein
MPQPKIQQTRLPEIESASIGLRVGNRTDDTLSRLAARLHALPNYRSLTIGTLFCISMYKSV